MNAARSLLGVYVRGRTGWHRLGIGWKYLVFCLLTVPVVWWGTPGVVLTALGASLALVATTRAPLRLAWGLPWGLAALLAGIGVFHAVRGDATLGVRIVGTTLVALYAARLVLLTTPLPTLVDALIAFLRPLRRIGLDTERVGLAVAVFLRSVPHLAASFGDVRDAARARGLTRNPIAALTPVAVQAVAYARATGDALHARGLADADEPPPPARDPAP